MGRPQVYLPHPSGLFGARLWRESLTLSQHKRAAQHAGTGCGGLGGCVCGGHGSGHALATPEPGNAPHNAHGCGGLGVAHVAAVEGRQQLRNKLQRNGCAKSASARQSQLPAFLRICAGARGCRGRGRNNAHGCLLLTRGAHSTWAHPTICVGTRVICGHLHRSVRDDFGRMPLVNPGGALDAGAPHAMR